MTNNNKFFKKNVQGDMCQVRFLWENAVTIIWSLSQRKDVKGRQSKGKYFPGKGNSMCIGYEASFSTAPLRNGKNFSVNSKDVIERAHQ